VERNAENREDWIEIQIGICTRLTDARSRFPSNIKFGQWCEANGFGESKLNKDERAAAINMGCDPDGLRECLKVTTRNSLRYIYDEEFSRLRYVAKTIKRRNAKLHLGEPSDQYKKAEAALADLEAEGVPITTQAIAERAGVSDTPVRRLMAVRRAEAELNPLTRDEMNKTMEKRFALAVKKARLEIREELKAEVYRELDVYVRHVKERSDRADRILGNYKGTMSKETFRKIKACLHPDHNSFKFAAEALQAFSELEAVLVKPDDPLYSGPPLPTTAAELMARRRR